jgi:hypothetical protein
MKLPTLVCTASTLLLAACGGGGGSNGSPPSSVQTVLAPGSGTSNAAVAPQAVSGTLTIGNPGSTSMASSRRPAFVSASTMHMAVFIDGTAAPAGVTATCTASTGTIPSGCTIPWSAQLTVPNLHTFAVEADSGTNAPANTVLSVGSASYTIVAGSANALTLPALSGIAHLVTFTTGTCNGTTPNSLCSGTITIADPANNAIASTGVADAFDNGPATFVSSSPAVGAITGTALAPFSTLAAGTLTVSDVNATGIDAFQVTCVAGATGTFGITLGGGTTANTGVTPAELAALTPPVTLPPPGLIVSGTPPTYTCTAGNMTSSAGGSLTVN